MERNPSEIIMIEKIYEYLERHPKSSISQISRSCRLNRRTVTKYLKFFNWAKTRSKIEEQKGKRGARVFSIVKPEESSFMLAEYCRDLSYATSRLKKIVTDLNLSAKAIDIIWDTYFHLVVPGILDCETFKEIFLDDMTAAVVYLTCRNSEPSLTLKRTSAICNTDEKRLVFCYNRLLRAVRIGGTVKLFLKTHKAKTSGSQTSSLI
jgi:transcription initiation factor TFIIIB Brf1 subunit/transcription initiation factor TFIIB